jgi:putative membrane protein
MRFLVRLLVNAAALWVATRLVSGVTYSGGWLPFLGVALVFGVINAFLRPVAKVRAHWDWASTSTASGPRSGARSS